MSRRAAVLLVSCAALGYACAPRNRVSNDEPAQQPSASEVATAIDTSSAFAVRLLESTNQRATSFAIEVTNTGKRDEMRFTSGKTHDFAVFDANDREVWRWSTGRLFTQSLQTRQLKTGDAVRYEAMWEAQQPGTYRVVAVLNRDTNPVQLEREFVVR
ncbi:MAG TPA: BsuPI-related putative proteinase inhibitor [Gemmatimonadaceae bacterium]|nr:BsuPI-related putative proteinase inhibitor [Gemmatimonadaceae bacterium]